MEISVGHFDGSMTQNQLDEALLVKFELRPKLDATASEEAGRPIYKDVEYIDIRQPGSAENVVRPATQADINRFPRHYAAFKNRTGDEETLEGTPLSEWPAVNRSQVEELAFFNIKTVEQLAATPDASGQGFMGFNSLKRKAKEWIELANMGVKASEMKAELEKRDEMIAKLSAEIESLKTKKTPARKKKATAKKE